MDDIDAAFEDMQQRVKMLPSQPNNVLLNLYGLYKQASQGDATGKRPGLTDFRGRAKYDAWAARKGMSQEDAKIEYVEYCEELGA